MKSMFAVAVAVLLCPNAAFVAAWAIEPPSQDPSAPTGQGEASGPRRPPAMEPGYLGLIGDDRNDRGRGIRVVEVRPGGPAHQAGVLPGDLIVGVSGIRIRQMADMVDIIKQAPPGSGVALDIHRNNERRNIHVTLGHRPAPHPSADAPAGKPSDRPAGPPPSRPPDPWQLDKPTVPHAAAEDSARLELLEQRLDRLEQRMAKMEQSMADLLKLLKGQHY